MPMPQRRDFSDFVGQSLLRVIIAPHNPSKIAVPMKALSGNGKIIAQVATLNLLGTSTFAESEALETPSL
jgi:hypothetical protein